jgi:hypothetical protein
MKRIFLLTVAALALTGCATSDYKGYSDIHVERAKTEAMRYKALASVARNSEDATTRALAAMALGIGGSNGSAAPVSAPQNEALAWGNLLVNGATSLYGLRLGTAVKLGDMSRGAANTDVLNNALSTVDIIRNTDTVK